MSEYQLSGVLLFGGMILWLLIGVALDTIDKAIKRRQDAKQKRIVKELARAVKRQQYAEFIAIANSYIK